MITTTITLYYNTKIGPSDIIDDPSLLSSATSLTLEDHVFLQDINLTSFKLKATWSQVKNADYCKINNSYYFIINRRMLNENCALLTIMLDALTTLGGPKNLNYTGGIITRAHAKTDNVLNNICDEPIGCSQILRAVHNEIGIGTGSLNVIASTLNLSDAEIDPDDTTTFRDAYVFNTEIGVGEAAENYSVVIPKTPAQAIATTIFGMTGATQTVGYGLYNFDNEVVQKNLHYIRSLGLSDCILFSYQIRGSFTKTETNGHIDSITSSNNFDQIVFNFNIETDYPSTVLNKKTYATHNSWVLKSILSGDQKEFRVSDLISPNTFYGGFAVDADLQYNGRPYISPSQIGGDPSLGIRIGNSVKGAPWKDMPIAFTSPSGSQWAKNDYAIQHANIERSVFSSTFSSASGGFENFGVSSDLITAIGSGLLGGLETIRTMGAENLKGNLDNRKFQHAQNAAKLLQARVVAPDLSTAPALGLQTLIQNGFSAIHLLPHETDIAAIDKFYTYYGYAQPNIVFDKTYLSGREHFNYISASDIHIIDNGNFGMDIIESAEAQLNGGVRIWHHLPTAAVSSNNIV